MTQQSQRYNFDTISKQQSMIDKLEKDLRARNNEIMAYKSDSKQLQKQSKSQMSTMQSQYKKLEKSYLKLKQDYDSLELIYNESNTHHNIGNHNIANNINKKKSSMNYNICNSSNNIKTSENKMTDIRLLLKNYIQSNHNTWHHIEMYHNQQAIIEPPLLVQSFYYRLYQSLHIRQINQQNCHLALFSIVLRLSMIVMFQVVVDYYI